MYLQSTTGRYQHVTDTLPTRYQTLDYDMNLIILFCILFYDTLPQYFKKKYILFV